MPIRADHISPELFAESNPAFLPFRYVWDPESVGRVFRRQLYADLISSDAFRRLGDLRFLGAIDYFVHPTGQGLNRRRHTRMEHSLGVAHLALLYSRLAQLEDQDEMLVVAAALLHDIGHAPLSHSIEALFKERFGLDHHGAGVQIILGRAPRGLGRDIQSALSREGLDATRVIQLLQGLLEDSPHNFLFSHPINIDTMEAINRSETYIKTTPASPTPDFILRALLDPLSHQGALDGFWNLKDQVYLRLIQSSVGLLADHISTQYVRRHIEQFSQDDFYSSERALRRKHPGLFRALDNARRHLFAGVVGSAGDAAVQIRFVVRRFVIDSDFQSDEPRRYQQTKSLSEVSISDLESRARSDIIQNSIELPF